MGGSTEARGEPIGLDAPRRHRAQPRILAAIQEAQLASVMNSYSEIDGVPVGASREILTELLRDEMGFGGTVISDYFTVPSRSSWITIYATAGAVDSQPLDG